MAMIEEKFLPVAKLRAAYHLYGKPGNSGENSNGTVHPGGIFQNKSNTVSMYYLFPVFTEMTKIFCTICLVNQCHAAFLLRRKIICFNPGPLVIWCFGNGTTLTHSSFRKRFQVQYHLSEMFTEIFLQMVSAVCTRGLCSSNQLLFFKKDAFQNTDFSCLHVKCQLKQKKKKKLTQHVCKDFPSCSRQVNE